MNITVFSRIIYRAGWLIYLLLNDVGMVDAWQISIITKGIHVGYYWTSSGKYTAVTAKRISS